MSVRVVVLSLPVLCLLSLAGCAASTPTFSPGPPASVRSDVVRHRDPSGVVEVDAVRTTWYEATQRGGVEQPAFWGARLLVNSMEPARTVEDVMTPELREATADLPEGFYPASVAEPTQRYIEVLTVRDDLGRTLLDSADGDGTLPRLDVMLSERFQGRQAGGASTSIGWKFEDDQASEVAVSGNLVIPRFREQRTVMLPLATLRQADRGTLAFGRGRRVIATTATDRVRVTTDDGGSRFEERVVEELVISVDLDVQAQTDLPVSVDFVMADGTIRPVPRWTGGGGSSVRGWSLRVRPSQVEPGGQPGGQAGDGTQVQALRFTLADQLELERHPFTISGVPIEYAPKPEPEAPGS